MTGGSCGDGCARRTGSPAREPAQLPRQAAERALVHGIHVPEDTGKTPNQAHRAASIGAGDGVLDLAVLQPQRKRVAFLDEQLGHVPAPAQGGIQDGRSQLGRKPGECRVAHAHARPGKNQPVMGLALRISDATFMNGSASAAFPGMASMEPSSK